MGAGIEHLFAKAVGLHQQGQWSQARKAYEHLLLLEPRHADAMFLLGLIAVHTGKTMRAVDWFDKAIGVRPNYAEAHTNRGLALQQMQRLDEAIVSLERAVQLKSNASSLLNLCQALLQSGRWQSTRDHAQSVLQLEPLNPEGLYNMGMACMGLGLWSDAQRAFEALVQIQPNRAPAWSNLGLVYKKLTQYDQALKCFDQASVLEPHEGEHFVNRGVVLLDLDRVQDALTAFKLGLERSPGSAQAHCGLGIALLEAQVFDEALKRFELALVIQPDLAQAHFNRAHTLRCLLRYEEVQASYLKAIEINPDYTEARWNLTLFRLEQGQFTKGWTGYHLRKHLETTSPIPWLDGVKRWKGGAPLGRLLITAEQGIGDEVFLTKALGLWCRQYGPPACVTVDARLLMVFRRSYPNLRFASRTLGGELDPDEFDQQMAMGDMASELILDPTQHPDVCAPHLVVNPALIDFGRSYTLQAKRSLIGLSWKSQNAKLGKEKSMTLMQIISVLGDLDVDWVSLQYGDVNDEIEQVRAAYGVHVHQIKGLDVMQDLDGLLSLISQCDAVLSTSNSVAHLTGSIGKQGIVLVPSGKGKLWYWHQQSGLSHWYPSLHVLHSRQAYPFGWGDLLLSAKEHLRTLHG
jgi:tetratricopeptide (TPR) repeat protein